MFGEPWLYAAVAAIALIQLAAFLLMSRRSGALDGPGATGPAEGGPSGAAAGGDQVRCQHCGTLNDAGYRFCARCVAELGGAAVRSTRDAKAA